MSQLIKIDLSNLCINSGSNSIGSRGVRLMMLSDFQSLKSLILGRNYPNTVNCRIGSEGFKHLSKQSMKGLNNF